MRRRKKNKAGIICCLLLLAHNVSFSQARTLTLTAYLDWVKKEHPIAKQILLLDKVSNVQVNAARAEFDPQVSADYSNKTFDGKNYYNYVEAEAKIPLWFGIDMKVGYDRVTGYQPNSENATSTAGLSYTGLSVPLLKNLLMDKRRAALKQAQLIPQINKNQQRQMLNDLLYEAATAYLQWQWQSMQVKVSAEATALALQRLEYTRNAHKLGDKAALDTLDALAQFNQRLYEWNDARLQERNASLFSSSYLWLPELQPAQLDSNIIPEQMDIAIKDTLIQKLGLAELEAAMLQNHPDLNAYHLKINSLLLEKRIKRESLLPSLNAEYYLLGKGAIPDPGKNLYYLTDRYKVGLHFQMPLTFSKARNDFMLAKLKISDANYGMENKAQVLKSKLRAYYNDYYTLLDQELLLQANVGNYQQLLKGEETRLLQGDTNLFMLNQRESKWVEARMKLLETSFKRYKAALSLKYCSALLLN